MRGNSVSVNVFFFIVPFEFIFRSKSDVAQQSGFGQSVSIVHTAGRFFTGLNQIQKFTPVTEQIGSSLSGRGKSGTGQSTTYTTKRE